MCKNIASLTALLKPRGVMVAQVVLVHLVEVRILTGLPFFYPRFYSDAEPE